MMNRYQISVLGDDVDAVVTYRHEILDAIKTSDSLTKSDRYSDYSYWFVVTDLASGDQVYQTKAVGRNIVRLAYLWLVRCVTRPLCRMGIHDFSQFVGTPKDGYHFCWRCGEKRPVAQTNNTQGD